MDQWNNFKTFWWMNVLGNIKKIHAQVDVRILRSSYFSYNLRNASPTIEVLIYLLYVLITVDVFVSLVKWTCLNQTFTQKWIPQYLYKKIISYRTFTFFCNIQTYVIRLAVPDSCSDKVSMQMSLSLLPPIHEVATLRPDCYRPHKKTYLLFAILRIDLRSTLNKLALESVNNFFFHFVLFN